MIGGAIRLATGRRAMFGAMLFAGLLIFVPLRLVLGWFGLGEAGLSARRVDGALWSGRLVEARFGEVALGDLNARLAFFPLFLGRARVELDGDGARPFTGAMTVRRHGFGIDDMTATLATGQLFAPLPVAALDLDDATVHFRDGQCDRADGRVRATLAGEAAGVPLPTTLSGPARCEAGALLLPLTSAAGTETATLRVFADGRYRAEFALRTADPLIGPRLESAGFVGGPQGYRLSVEGRF
ncbi:MAG: type secretion system protein [Sphingomonas bacterium]|uniref:type II secretion system protein N n=1 Tax=Sphingomonas bacterium TaxID=1895847 RepID=UPI002609AAF5|nr:type II secretion system protein N [Sphingomonas bacterium]MDB5695369.1 type secretion system protein [Sphingomonas bacterium]